VKKSLIFLMVMCLVFSCTVSAFADITGNFSPTFAEDRAATNGVDVVVVLDMSGSMTKLGEKDGNDKQGYRLDATAMLAGMLDMDGSRIGVVPFGGITNQQEVIDLTEMTDSTSRTRFIEKIYSLREVAYGTNTGAALMTALYMLDIRENKANSPMIVLMTDGRNEVQYSANEPTRKVDEKPAYRWDASSGAINQKSLEKYDTDLANSVTEEAIQCAVSMNVPIYTVALTIDPSIPQGRTMALSEISKRTGVGDEGVLWARDRNEAKKIPRYFADILAGKIGSSVQETAKPEAVPGLENTYQIKIPVLNNSIHEINIFLPVKRDPNGTRGRVDADISGIIKNTIKVKNAEGVDQSDSNGVSIWCDDSRKGAFAIIKIREPQSTGKMWTLQFQSVDVPDNIQFNFLYNYDIKLKAEIQSNTDLYKSDSLQASTFFIETVGGTERQTDDNTLYINHDNDPDFEGYSWATIRAKWQLFSVNLDGSLSDYPVDMMEPVEMPAGEQDFHTEINLAELFPTLKSGSYALVVTAEGAGLKRVVELPLRLKNHVPAAEPYIPESIVVNKSEEAAQNGGQAGASWTVAGTSKDLKNAAEIVTDADSTDTETLKRSFRLEAVGADQAATIELKSDGTLHVTTKEDGRGGVLAGDVEYKLYYDDKDAGGDGSVPISLKIISDDEELKKSYDPEITFSGTNAEGKADDDHTYKKNTSLTVTAGLKKKDGTAKDAGVLERLHKKLTITGADGNPVAVDGETLVIPDPVLTDEGWQWTIASTGNQQADWTAKIELGTFEVSPVEIVIPNQEPPVPAPAKDIAINCNEKKVPGFLRSLVGKDTAEDDPVRTVYTQSMFTDVDNDKLDCTAPTFTDTKGKELNDPETIKAEAVADAEDTYLITVTGKPTSLFKYSYTCQMKITATDGDGESAVFTQTIVVTDLYNKMLTWIIAILIAIILLVILILIIHQIRKPVFPKLNLTIREEPSLYETCSETLSPVKKPTNANAIGVDSDMAAKHGLSLELLQNTIIKPIRSTLAVGVICKKEIPGQEVTLDDVRLKAKKLYTWRIGQELGIRSDHGEGMVVIKLEDRTDNMEDTTMDDFGGTDEWAEVAEESNDASNVKKRSRKVARKPKPAEEDTSSAGQSNDFDF